MARNTRALSARERSPTGRRCSRNEGAIRLDLLVVPPANFQEAQPAQAFSVGAVRHEADLSLIVRGLLKPRRLLARLPVARRVGEEQGVADLVNESRGPVLARELHE